MEITKLIMFPLFNLPNLILFHTRVRAYTRKFKVIEKKINVYLFSPSGKRMV